MIEFVIDCLWLVNMCVSFTTAHVKDVDLVTDLKEIALKYFREGFVVDFLTTFSTLVTFYRWPNIYYVKILRLYYIQRSQKIIKVQIQSLESRWNISKQTIYKVEYFTSILVMVYVMMHTVSCVWLMIGEEYEYSWIKHHTLGLNALYGTIELEDGSWEANRVTKYITAFYWAVTTLATVGYGDVKGFTWQEYCFNMFVEFIGIAFFSFVMGSINNIFLVDSSSKELVQTKLEQVDVWLVKLDNSRTSKSLPKILYDKIKLYIKESMYNDHSKLIYGYEFLY